MRENHALNLCRIGFAGHPLPDRADFSLLMPATIKRGNIEGVGEAPKLAGNGGRGHAASTQKPKSKSKHTKPSAYYATVFPGKMAPLPVQFAKGILALEKMLGGFPIWLVVQPSCPNCGLGAGQIENQLFLAFEREYLKMPQGKPVGLLIESIGGDAHTAYRIGRLLQRRSGNNVTAIIPQRAKSAATLMALCAKQIILGPNAELGPLDVQMFDSQKEEYGSALDAVQSLECLNAFGMAAADQVLRIMQDATEKRTDVLLPHVMNYVTQFMRPLLERIDIVDYTLKSRELRVAEEYAVRLLAKNHQGDERRIAKQLVENYPTHGFSIVQEEAATGQEEGGLGLNIISMGDKAKKFEGIVDGLLPYLCLPYFHGMPPFVIGRILCQ